MDHGWLKFRNGSFCVWKVPVFLKQSDEWFFSRTWFLLGVQLQPNSRVTKGGWYQDEERQMQIKIVTISRCWSTFSWGVCDEESPFGRRVLNVQNGSTWHIEASMEKPPSPNLSFIELSQPHSSWFTFRYFTLQTTLLHVHPVTLAAGTPKMKIFEDDFPFQLGDFLG